MARCTPPSAAPACGFFQPQDLADEIWTSRGPPAAPLAASQSRCLKLGASCCSDARDQREWRASAKYRKWSCAPKALWQTRFLPFCHYEPCVLPTLAEKFFAQAGAELQATDGQLLTSFVFFFFSIPPVSLPLPYVTIASFSTLPFLFYFIFIQSIVPCQTDS